MTDLGKAPEQLGPREQRAMDIAAQRAPECMITFDITGGIFGVGRLAAAGRAFAQRTDRCLAHRSLGRLAA